MYIFSLLGYEKENNGFHNILLWKPYDSFHHNLYVFVIPIYTRICIQRYENHILEIKGGVDTWVCLDREGTTSVIHTVGVWVFNYKW